MSFFSSFAWQVCSFPHCLRHRSEQGLGFRVYCNG
ncbi:MAG: hypothetical protein C0413_01700 [Clostridiales bacterium]|nr:hypothetical protein [Clostridiales bacterium]